MRSKFLEAILKWLNCLDTTIIFNKINEILTYNNNFTHTRLNLMDEMRPLRQSDQDAGSFPSFVWLANTLGKVIANP